MTTERELIIQLRDALETAYERYGAIDPDYHPGETDSSGDGDEDEPLHEEADEIDAALEAANAYLASTRVQAIDG